MRLARREELSVRRDSLAFDLGHIDEFGRYRRAGDFGKNIGAPMRDRARHFDRQAQELIIVEPEHFDHHGEPWPKLREGLGANGDRLIGACAQDFVSACIGKNAAHAGEIARHARCVELLNYSFRDDALGHVMSP
jgi:hypothetical protein